MLLISSLVFVLGTVAVTVSNAASIVRGYDQSDTYRERARLDDVFRAIDQLEAAS